MQLLIPQTLGLVSSLFVLLISVTMINGGESMKWYAINTFSISSIAETLEVVGEFSDDLNWDKSDTIWYTVYTLMNFFNLWYFVHVRLVFVCALCELYVLYHPHNRFKSLFTKRIPLHLCLPLLSILVCLPSAILSLFFGSKDMVIHLQYTLTLSFIAITSFFLSISMLYVIYKSKIYGGCRLTYKKRLIAFSIYFMPANLVDIPVICATICMFVHWLVRKPLSYTEVSILMVTEEIRQYHITVLALSSITAFAPYRKALIKLFKKLFCLKLKADSVSSVVIILDRKLDTHHSHCSSGKRMQRFEDRKGKRVLPMNARKTAGIKIW